jgi:hypothetical protein
MENNKIRTLVKRKALLTAFTLVAIILASASLSRVLAQGSEDRAIAQAQRAVRERILNQEGRRNSRESGRNPLVLFNNDAQTEFKSNTEVRVRGTGTFTRNSDSRTDDLRNNNSRADHSRDNDSDYNRSRNNDERARDFSYEAIVNTRNRYGNVSDIQYNWRGRRTGNNQPDDSNQPYDRDRNDNYDRDSNGGNRPNGRVSYSGPILNRNSNKCLDVTERSMRDGAAIQQWGYADQDNQNWEVIDLGNREVAIISRQSGKALTVQGGRDDNGANIIQRSWNDSPQQRWRLEQVGGDYYRIVSVDSGKCLDVTERGKQDGASIQLLDYANQTNQQWRLKR